MPDVLRVYLAGHMGTRVPILFHLQPETPFSVNIFKRFAAPEGGTCEHVILSLLLRTTTAHVLLCLVYKGALPLPSVAVF